MNRKTRRAQDQSRPASAQAHPSQASQWFVEAVSHHQAGRVAEAERLYDRILALQPTHAEAWSNLALALMMRGRHQEAASACEKALALRPAYIEARLNLITALEALQRFDRAAEVYREVLVLAPDRADLHTNFGVNLERRNDLAGAAEAYRAALRLTPDDPDIRFNLARALSNGGRLDEAVEAYRQVVARQPNQAAAYSNLGTILCTLSRFDEAAEAALRAAALMPDSPAVLLNLGVVLQKQGKVNEAVLAYRRAIAIDPGQASAYGNLGVALQEQFKFDEAVDALKGAIALKPDFDAAIIELIKMRRHICDWSDYDADRLKLHDYIAQKKDAIFMLLLMAFPSTPSQQRACASQTMDRLNRRRPRFTSYRESDGDARVRIGYYSNDYRDHPVGRLLPELFATHDRSGFEVFAYSTGTEDAGMVRQRIRAGAEHFIDLHPLSDRAAADRIHADGIDILVDLTGPTVGSRLDILVDRPAGVQVSFLGWPGTMGLTCMDYIVADPVLLPFDQQPCYTEAIVHLPDCYQPSDSRRETARLDLTRAECGLPEGAFVFCSFNNTVKITPDVFEVWMSLLRAVDHSVLWLYCKSPTTMANLRAAAERSGVAPARLIFASVAPMDGYLARLRLADLFLDSHPYNAGATCNDALWAGLPVLTCAGETYVSRMAASLLTNVGLPDFVTGSLDEYRRRAIRLATERDALDDARRRLAAGRETAPLFDMPRFTRHIEAAFRTMRRLRREGSAPRSFAVEPCAAPRRSAA